MTSIVSTYHAAILSVSSLFLDLFLLPLIEPTPPPNPYFLLRVYIPEWRMHTFALHCLAYICLGLLFRRVYFQSQMD